MVNWVWVVDQLSLYIIRVKTGFTELSQGGVKVSKLVGLYIRVCQKVEVKQVDTDLRSKLCWPFN